MENNTISLHQVGYLVKNIEESKLAFEKMGLMITKDITFDSDRKVDICFMGSGSYEIELVSPRNDSNIYPLLKRYNNVPYHTCYIVKNICETINELTKKGFLLIEEPSRALAISECARVAFLMNAKIGIVELLQFVI